MSVSGEVESFRMYVNETPIATEQMSAGGTYKVDLSACALDGVNTLQVSNISPAGLQKAVSVTITYPEVLEGTLEEAGISPQTTDLRPYINDMGLVMTAADLIISRAGGSTLAEITNTGTASILVPSPNVTANQQEKNAAELQKHGAAIMLRESECSGAALYEETKRLLTDEKRLAAVAKRAKELGRPKAREKIAEIVLGLVK